MVSASARFVNGLAIGIFAAGSGVFAPVASALIARVGWRSTLQILALAFFVLTMTGSMLLKNPPEGYGGQPGKANGPRQRATLGKDTRTLEVVCEPLFGWLWIAYALGTAAGTMVISQLVPFARQAGYGVVATAILDRLLHHSTTINIRGESYWLKDRRKAGLFPP